MTGLRGSPTFIARAGGIGNAHGLFPLKLPYARGSMSANTTIMLVDDEEMVLTSLSSFLMLETDYDVVTFTSGHQALQHLEGHTIDVVVSAPGYQSKTVPGIASGDRQLRVALDKVEVETAPATPAAKPPLRAKKPPRAKKPRSKRPKKPAGKRAPAPPAHASESACEKAARIGAALTIPPRDRP